MPQIICFYFFDLHSQFFDKVDFMIWDIPWLFCLIAYLPHFDNHIFNIKIGKTN